MITSLVRVILSNRSSGLRICSRLLAGPVTASRNAIEQMEYIKSETVNKINDWTVFKQNILSLSGSLNEKNIDSVILKTLNNEKKYDVALSFANHLKSSGELSLGAINGILHLYYAIGQQNELPEESKEFILESYKYLYDKYKLLDATTCESLLHALCVIKEHKKALKVLEDIYQSSKPSHSAYSTLIATYFKLNKKIDALKLIKRSISEDRPLQPVAYKGWIDYIFRKYKDKKTIIKYLNEICQLIADYYILIPDATADCLKEAYTSVGWNPEYTKIKKSNGECAACNQHLERLALTDEEFKILQLNVKDKLIVGSDLFLKTSPEELNRFLSFVEQTAPYDVVLDALNIAYSLGKGDKMDKVRGIMYVVEYFRERNKRIMLLGRKHMLGWPKMRSLLSKTCHFFTENITQDDPYFLTAAILSGPETDIVSKDLLRGHCFNMREQNLRLLFQRWQWQHQWKTFVGARGQAVILPPLPISPCAQCSDGGSRWHVPVCSPRPAGLTREPAPLWHRWLCIKPK